MEKDGLAFAVNVTDYQKKIESFDYDKLQAEKQKILDKENLNYTCVGINNFEVKRLNIQNSPDEKNRIYVRKKVAMANRIINAKLNEYATDFSSYWQYINDEFIKTTSSPDYASAKLEKKTVPLADKLNLKGLVAYKRYLMLVAKELDKLPNFKMAVQVALDVEKDVDKNFDREDFFTRFFLPSNIDTIYKNLIREKCVNDKMKQLGNIKEAESQEKETETK